MTGKDASLTSVTMASSTDAITNTEVNLAVASSTHSEANLGIALSTDAITNKEASGTIALPMYSKANTDAKAAIPPIASASPSPAATMTNSDAKLALPSLFSSPAASSPAPGGLQPEEGGLSAVRSCGGVGVTLENSSVWKEFHRYGTEMILTKQGRRMFPYCLYHLTGLEPTRRYALVLSITPIDTYRHRWNLEWEPSGPGEPLSQASRRVFPHQDSSALGKVWMASLVSFYKLKLTNHCLDQEGHVMLHSMHRYRPSLHVIPVADGEDLGFDPKMLYLQLFSPKVMTFTFPQTEFYAVTSYQNTRITQLKIDYNPFAKGFREDSGSPRLTKPRPEQSQAGKGDTRSPGLSSARPDGRKGTEQIVTVSGVADLSMKKDYLSTTHPVEAEVSAKLRRVAPGTATTADSDASQTDVSASEEGIDLDDSDGDHVFHRRYLQAQLALSSGASRPGERQGSGEERQGGAGMDPFIQASLTANTHNATQYAALHTNSCSKPSESSTVEPMKSEVPSSKKVTLVEPTMTSPILVAEPQEGKAASLTPKTSKLQKIAPKPSPSPSLPTPTTSPFAVPKPWKKGRKSGGNRWGNAGKVTKGTKVAKAAVTLTSSPVTVAMQPQLDDVEGLLFVSFTSKEALGVHVEDMPPSNTSPVVQEHPERTDGSRSFVSRTGKTSDLTKIKGWRDKFIRTRVSSQNQNRSAFCSDTLDQYLEREAQRIRACTDAFSHNPLGSVAYQLPVTSYVRTQESVLKMRAPLPQPPAFCRPCPLSPKPLLYAALKKPPSPIKDHVTPPKAAKPKPNHAPPQGKQHHITPEQGKGRFASVLRPIQVSNSNKTTAAEATAEVKVTSPNAQSSLPGKEAVRRDTSPGGSLSSGLSGLSKIQLKMMEMEDATFYQGHDRTHITTERVETALMALLTAQGLSKIRAPNASPVDGPECGSEFCRLGCVCSSLARVSRGPLHCYRPDCMLGCSCFKCKITKQTTAAENHQNQMLPVYTMSKVDHEVQPNRGIRVFTLWDLTSGVDPEPLFIPKTAANIPIKPLTRIYHLGYIPRLTPKLREEDKDPVHKYVESVMTCASVREFNTKPTPQVLPPQVHLFNDSSGFIIPSSGKKKIAAVLSPPTKPVVPMKSPPSQAKKPEGPLEPTIELEIQSECNWDQHQKLVLGVLCRRMTQNRLSEPFNIGRYHVRLLSNTHTCKAEGNIIIFKVCISKAKDDKTDDVDQSDSEVTDDSDEDEKEEEGIPEPEKPEVQVGVTRFLTGVVPAGRLRARKKPPACPAVGLIQVNGKSYSQARLLLGQMGALHPTNRLAAFVTGRLRSVAKATQKPLSCSPRLKKTPGGAGRFKTAGTAVTPLGSSSVTSLSRAQKVFQTPAGKNTLPPYKPPWSLGVTKSKGKTSTSQTTTNKDPKDPAGSHLLLIPMAPPAPGTSPGSRPGVVPPVGKKMLLQTVASSQFCKTYHQTNGHVIKPLPLNQICHIKAKNQKNTPGSAIKPSTRKTLPPPPHLTSIHHPPHSPHIKFITGQSGAFTPSQTSSSSPVSLTISTSLKTPSFLGQIGTYSFRICSPIAGDQGTRSPGQGTMEGPAGVALPGGFTLIQLPKSVGTDGAPRLPKLIRTTAVGEAVAARTSQQGVPHLETKSFSGPAGGKAQKNQKGTSSPSPLALIEVQTETVQSAKLSYTPELNTNTPDSRLALAQKKQSLTQSKGLKSDLRSAKVNYSSPTEPNELTCDVGEGSRPWSPESCQKDTKFSPFPTLRMHENGHPDFNVEDSDSDPGDSSDDSDSDSDKYAEEEEEEAVDIETVEERRRGITVPQMRAAVKRTQQNSQDEETAPKETRQREKREEEGSGEGGGRKNRTLTERLRRGEHQELFTRLKQVLFMEKLDPKVSKLHLLSQALKEIRTLSVDSESLEENKRMLTEIQSVYVKEITYISGKSEEQIKAKLKEIWEKKRALAAQRRADVPCTSVHVSSTCQLSSTAFTLSPNTLTAGGAVCPVKVMKRPSTVTSLSSTTTSAAKEAVKKEGAEEKECTLRIIHPSQPLSQTPSLQCSASATDPEKKYQSRVSGQAEQSSDSPAEERPEVGKEEPQAPVYNGSMEEETSTEKDNISTPTEKKSLVNRNLINRLSVMTYPLVDSAPLNSVIWRPLEKPQAVGKRDPGGWGLSLTKGEAAVLVKALSEHEGIVVGRKGKDSTVTPKREENLVQHNGKKSSVTLKGKSSSVTQKRKDSSELQKEQDSTTSQKETNNLVPQKGEDSSGPPKENYSFITQKAKDGLVTSKENDCLLTQKGGGGLADGFEAPTVKRTRRPPRLDIKSPPTEHITTTPVATTGGGPANVTQATGSARTPVSRPGGILVTNTGDGENQLTPREPTRQGRTPKVRRVGFTTSPVAMTGPGGNSAKVTPAGGIPVKRAASSPATRGRPPKVRKAGDSPSPAPGTRAGLSPVVKTDGSAAKPTRGDSPARTTRAGVNSSAAMTKGSPGKTPQAIGRPGTQPVTRSVGGKRTMRSDKA